MASRPATYRRRGPEGLLPDSLQRLLDGAADIVNRQLRAHSGWRVAAAASVPAAIALIAARRRIGMHPAVTLTLGCVPPLGCAIATPKGRKRYAAVAAAYMHLFKLGWELPYDHPEKLRRRLWIDEPIRFDTVVGLGVPPGLRLQRALRRRGEVTAFDRFVTVVYGSWFVPQLLLAYLFVRHEAYVPRAGARLAAAYHLTCPFYFFAAEAPPWWASEKEGRMGGEIDRVARIVVCDLLKRDPPGEGAVPGNPWGSMPSDHISSAAITAMGLHEVSPLYGALGWSYVAAASFAVVYLGEHYVADVVVGLLIADAVRRIEPLAAPFVRAVARAVE
ncbi:MAG TPA: phosphatase PAP2 family protein [Solirubrobacteraceae bacterium]|nr:phosphatase PAP2 family protein [Solirubrobacteraceae bacterium]